LITELFECSSTKIGQGNATTGGRAYRNRPTKAFETPHPLLTTSILKQNGTG
jgi:hypothetical protein